MNTRFFIPAIATCLASLTFGLAQANAATTNVSFSVADRINSSSPGTTWTVDSGGGTGDNSALLVGDSSNNTAIFETILLINISAFDSQIASADTITFNIAYSSKLGAGQSVTAYMFGTNSGSLSSSFHTSGLGLAGSNIGTIPKTSFANGNTGGVATYNATSVVQGLTAFDYIGIVLSSGLTANDGGGAADAIEFYKQTTLVNQTNGGAYLSITTSTIPEPSTYAMLLGGFVGLVALSRRNRRA